MLRRGGGALSRSLLWALPLLLLLSAAPAGAQTAAYTLSCPGVVSTDASTGAALCTDGGSPPNVVQWVAVPPFDVSQLDYAEAGQAFAAGFVMVGMCWCLGQAVGAILRMVRR